MKITVVVLLSFTIGSYVNASDYKITPGKIGDLGIMNISNTHTGEHVVIVTDFGGRIEELYLASKSTGKVRDVLLTHHGNSTAIRENTFWKGMLLMPYANRIAYGKYTFYNGSYQLPLNDEPRGKNALHGFLPNKTLTIVSQSITNEEAVLSTSVSIQNEPGYPFNLKVMIDYSMSISDGFSISVTAINLNGDGTPLPFYVGWHPYFKCTPETTIVEFDPCHKWVNVELNANMDPTGVTNNFNPFDGTKPIGGEPGKPTFYDSEFKSLMSGSQCGGSTTQAMITDQASGQSMVLWQDFDNHIMHVYTGYTEEGSVAVEPMSAMADAYNNGDGLSILSGGQSWTGSFGIYVR